MGVARQVFVLLSVLVVSWGLERCEASGKFSFEVHHVFSDAVKQTLGFDHLLPKEGSLDYYKVLAHRDRLIRGRGLASNNEEPPLTSMAGNLTLSIGFLGFLHYANITVGTPPTWFLVALDTGSDLFWLPCNCGTTCIRDLKDAGFSGSIPLNLYSPIASSTSSSIRCSDRRCFDSRSCSSSSSVCPYHFSNSLSTNTTGTLLQDVLHLITDDEDLKPLKANITLGCGQNQTGFYQTTHSVNGVLGLGVKDYSVPSLLAKAKIAANSFSMCFGRIVSIVGRINFGDKGYSDQEETPFISVEPSTAYGVNVTGLSVGGDPVGFRMFASFDTGQAFTHLMEPGYSAFTKAFDDLVNDTRRPADPELPFEFCYDLRPNFTIITFPAIDLTFGGGSKMTIMNPFFSTETEEGNLMYCLGVLENAAFNIIGQTMMYGHRIVFDRERMILGWKLSDCYEDESLTSTTTSRPPPSSPETESPSPPTVSSPLPRSPPPPRSPSPPVVFDLTPPPPRASSTGENNGAANLIPLASQILLLLPLLVFL